MRYFFLHTVIHTNDHFLRIYLNDLHAFGKLPIFNSLKTIDIESF